MTFMQYYFLCVLSKVFDNPHEIPVLFSLFAINTGIKEQLIEI